MSPNDPGGGPRRRGRGGDGKGPWGSGPGQSGPTLPDLEEFLRRSQDKLRNILPGGNRGGRGLSLLVLAAIALWGFSGFFRVDPDELGVVLRFGKYVRDAKPGLNYHLPYPIESALTPKVHARQPHRHWHAARCRRTPCLACRGWPWRRR